MEIINIQDNTANQRSKSRTIDWIKINGDDCRTYNKNQQIKFETKMFKISLCDKSDSYMFIK